MAEQQAIQRRLRYERRSTGKRVAPTERDLVWFRALHQHGPLPSSFLLEFTRDIRRNDTRSLERLGDLYHQASTPHGGPYLDRPPAQWTATSKFERTVYDLTPAAEQALAEHGIIEPSRPASRVLFHHRLMTACITASIELATKRNPALRFIPQQEILERSPNRRAVIPCRVSYTSARTGKAHALDGSLVPDALFGIEYTTMNGKRYRFFMVEADRAHEPVRRADLRETSYLRKVLQYREVIGNDIYRKHFGMKSAMLVLTVTTNLRHLNGIMAMVKEAVGAADCPYMLFTVAAEFGDRLRVPDPCDHLLTQPWQRAGLPDLRIDLPGDENRWPR